MSEAAFKKKFIEDAKIRLEPYEPDVINVKSGYRSYPDTLFLGDCVWALLEFKKHRNASQQPNQDHHISRLNKKGFAKFVHPNNAEETLDELERLFIFGQRSCVLKP